MLCAWLGAGGRGLVVGAEAGKKPTTRQVSFGSVVRPREWPLKRSRSLWTDAEIAQARRNVEQYPGARKLRDACVKAADGMLKWSDEALKERIPTAEVPRAFNVGTVGCPVHGKKVFEKGGTYPWITDPNRPFKIKCPVGGEWYPSNDFYAYFRGGMRDRSLLTGSHADDGWGWVGPKGERYWLVGYACHWGEWRRLVLNGLDNLARAYLLTGDRRYAHKAGVILVKIAQTYPALDYCQQSRYSQISGGRYHGKILNLIWETGVFTNLARAYDAVWETIDDDKTLAALYGYASGEEVRSLIESNLLEDGIDAIFAGKIRGNFGMHQRALATGAVVRQTGPTREWLGGILTRNTGSHRQLGLNYALYNTVYRDGMPEETSPGYCFGWTRNLYTTAMALAKAGIDLFELPKLRSMADAPLDMICIDKFTPSLGDAGNVWGGLTPRSPAVYQAAYQAYKDPRYARWLARLKAAGADSFKTFDSLFRPPVEVGGTTQASAEARGRSRLMDGYGLALLRNAANTMGVSLYYGMKGGHGHFDRLHFDLYANGCPMMPDLGYPDFMNGYVPGIYSWSKNTINHNTVTVNKTRQQGNDPGVVHHFVDVDGLRAVDIDAPTTYANLKMYRRCLMQVETGPDTGYLVDVFRVRGGEHHVYSLHGPPGTFEIVSGAFAEPAKGTLAGADVAVGTLYDDPARSKPGYKGTYYGYTGSGYSHFVNVRRRTEGAFCGRWQRSKATGARLRIHVLLQPEQELLLADAQISPVKRKRLLKYVLVRREGKDLDSTFVSVIEPFGDEPAITSVSQLNVPAPAVGVEIRRGKELDVIIQQPDTGRAVVVGKGIRTDAAMTLVRYDPTGRARRAIVVGGGEVQIDGHRITPCRIAGQVTDVSPAAGRGGRRVGVRFDGDKDPPVKLAGRSVCFMHGQRRAWHPVAQFDAHRKMGGASLGLGDDLLIGRFRVDKVEGNKILTRTALIFSPIYAGSYVTDDAFSTYTPVQSAGTGQVTLAKPLAKPPKPGQDMWLVDVGPGDRAVFETVTVRAFDVGRGGGQ